MDLRKYSNYFLHNFRLIGDEVLGR